MDGNYSTDFPKFTCVRINGSCKRCRGAEVSHYITMLQLAAVVLEVLPITSPFFETLLNINSTVKLLRKALYLCISILKKTS